MRFYIVCVLFSLLAVVVSFEVAQADAPPPQPKTDPRIPPGCHGSVVEFAEPGFVEEIRITYTCETPQEGGGVWIKSVAITTTNSVRDLMTDYRPDGQQFTFNETRTTIDQVVSAAGIPLFDNREEFEQTTLWVFNGSGARQYYDTVNVTNNGSMSSGLIRQWTDSYEFTYDSRFNADNERTAFKEEEKESYSRRGPYGAYTGELESTFAVSGTVGQWSVLEVIDGETIVDARDTFNLAQPEPEDSTPTEDSPTGEPPDQPDAPEFADTAKVPGEPVDEMNPDANDETGGEDFAALDNAEEEGLDDSTDEQHLSEELGSEELATDSAFDEQTQNSQ